MVLGAFLLTGCTPARPAPRPLLTGAPSSVRAPDPSQTRYHGWGTIDEAVTAGAIEHSVVATPVETIGTRFRTYTLLGPHDQPGELRVERADDRLVVTVRMGRFGLPDLEADVGAAVRRELSRSGR